MKPRKGGYPKLQPKAKKPASPKNFTRSPKQRFEQFYESTHFEGCTNETGVDLSAGAGCVQRIAAAMMVVGDKMPKRQKILVCVKVRPDMLRDWFPRKLIDLCWLSVEAEQLAHYLVSALNEAFMKALPMWNTEDCWLEKRMVTHEISSRHGNDWQLVFSFREPESLYSHRVSSFKLIPKSAREQRLLYDRASRILRQGGPSEADVKKSLKKVTFDGT